MSLFSSFLIHLGKEAGKDIENSVNYLLPRGKSISYLDCGCADGSKTINRAKIIGTTIFSGVEVVPKLSKLSMDKKIKVYKFDLNDRWLIHKNSIDCITATEVVEHLINLDNFFEEAKRVLKREGYLILSTENLASFHNIFALLIGIQPYTGPYLSRKFSIGHRPINYYKNDKLSAVMPPHLNVMTTKSLIQLLENYGFKIEKIIRVAFYPLPKPFSLLFNTLFKYHSSYIVIKAVKIM